MKYEYVMPENPKTNVKDKNGNIYKSKGSYYEDQHGDLLTWDYLLKYEGPLEDIETPKPGDVMKNTQYKDTLYIRIFDGNVWNEYSISKSFIIEDAGYEDAEDISEWLYSSQWKKVDHK